MTCKLLGKKVERYKKEKTENKTKEQLELREIKRKIDVEKEKERRKELYKKSLQQQPQVEVTPNNTLFIENLKPSVTETILKDTFSKYSGFK